MKSCGRWAIINPQKKIMQPFWCGSIRCGRDLCRTLFRKRRIRLLTSLITHESLNQFVTLTLDPANVNYDYEKCWEYIHKPWSKLRKRLHRIYSQDPDEETHFRYVAILEGHPGKTKRAGTSPAYEMKGQPHIHAFWNINIQAVRKTGEVWKEGMLKTLAELWEECGGGMDVETAPVVGVSDISDYVSKQLAVASYVSKDGLESAARNNGRRKTLWRTQGMKAKFELTKDKNWSILKEDVYEDGKRISHQSTYFGVVQYGEEE